MQFNGCSSKFHFHDIKKQCTLKKMFPATKHSNLQGNKLLFRKNYFRSQSCVNILNQSLKNEQMPYLTSFKKSKFFKYSKYLTTSSYSTYLHREGLPAVLPKLTTLLFRCEEFFSFFIEHSTIN